MSMKSKNMTHMDVIWTAYVAADPDLNELERQKRETTYRQTLRAFARQRRVERFKEMAAVAGITFLIVWVLMFLAFGLC